MAEVGTVSVGIKGDFDEFDKSAKAQIGGIGVAAAGLFAAAFAARKLFDFGAQAVKEASDLGESVNAINQTFEGVNLDVIRAIGDNSATSFGLAESEFNQFAVSFSGIADSIAGPGGDVSTVINDMTTRVADFASVMNLEVADAGDKFRSIMAGSSEVARQYGIDVSEASVAQFAIETGLVNSASEMTEAMKIQARYGLLMQRTEQWAGDFAATSGDLANATRIAGAEFQDAKAAIGVALLPVMKEVVGLVRDHLIPIVGTLTPVFTQVASAIGQLLPPVASLIERLMPLITKILPILTEILVQVLDLFIALAIPIIDLVIAVLTPLLDILSPLIDVLLEALMPAITAVAQSVTALTPLLDLLIPIIKLVADIVGVLAKGLGIVLSAAIKVVVGLLEVIIGVVRNVILWFADLASLIGGGLSDAFHGVMDFFHDLPGQILDFLRDAGTWLLNIGKDLIQGLINGIKSMAGNIVNAIKTFVIGMIPGPIKAFFGLGSPSKLMMEYGRNISEGMALGIRGASGKVSSAVDSLLHAPKLGLGIPGFGNVSLPGGGLTQIFNAPVGGDMGLFAQQMAAAQARELRYQLG